MRQIVLDTETTGFDPRLGNRIIEIGCVELVNRRLTGSHYHVYINPQRESEEGAFQVHKLSSEFLADKPLFKDIAQEFVDYISGSELIIHNAPFDVGFLNHELKIVPGNTTLIADLCTVVDSLVIAREKHPGQKNTLDALCNRYSVSRSERDVQGHGALLDAELLAQVFILMTGGQRDLSWDIENKSSYGRSAEEATLIKRNNLSLLIQRAKPEELMAHQKLLSEIARQSHALQWQEGESIPSKSE